MEETSNIEIGLAAAPYVAALYLWVRCAVFLKRHGTSFSSTHRSAFWSGLAFGGASVTAGTLTIVRPLTAFGSSGWVPLAMDLGILSAVVYVVYFALFYGGWIVYLFLFPTRA